MKLGLLLPAVADRRWKIASQVGIKYIVTKAAPEITGKLPPWDLDSLASIHKALADAGFIVHGLEGDQFDMSRIKLGLKGRDEDLEKYRSMLKNMGQLGINLLCYNFMAGVGWYRSNNAIPYRGGALTSGFNLQDTDPDSYDLQITQEKLWDNYKYFIDAVLPTAKEAGVKMALHPDDPPVTPLKGYSRIFINADAYRKAMSLHDCSEHGIAFCQATFKAMGEDFIELIKEFAKAGKINFFHLRDIEGTKENFQETFHDNGPSDLTASLELLNQLGVDCLLRPDHAPSMDGEDNSDPGYGILGRMFAIGYLKGALDSINHR